MAQRNVRLAWPLILGVVVGITLLLCALTFCGALAFLRPSSSNTATPPDLTGNGAQIYWRGTSLSDGPIRYDWPAMPMMSGRAGQLACVTCHGRDGRGGTVRLMMNRVKVPDIRYSTLTSPHGEDDEQEPAWSDEDIKRAITTGVEPNGEELKSWMPRWEMSEGDLNDLLEYLKALD